MTVWLIGNLDLKIEPEIEHTKDVQDKCFAEVSACFQKHGKFDESDCNYLRATMDEVFRFRPVTDSLLHLVSEDTIFNNVLVPKGIRSLFIVDFGVI